MSDTPAKICSEIDEYIRTDPNPDSQKIYEMVCRLAATQGRTPGDALVYANFADGMLDALIDLAGQVPGGAHIASAAVMTRTMLARARWTLDLCDAIVEQQQQGRTLH